MDMDIGFERHLLAPRADDAQKRGHRALVVTAVLTAISCVIVAIRLYARVGLIKFMGREDWTILVSLVFAIVYLGFVAGGTLALVQSYPNLHILTSIAETSYGLGAHAASLSDHTLQQQLKMLWVAIPFYNASLACTKFSILFQYLRIFPAKSFRIACWVVMGIVALYSSWAIVSGFVNCVPVEKFWNKKIEGNCLSFEAVWFFNASMNIATDLALLIMPMPLLSQLHLPRMQKLALVAVFAIGGLVVITSALRLSSLREVARATDTSYSNVGAAYWTAAECNVAIICASLPFLRSVITLVFPKLMPSNSYRRTGVTRTQTATNRSQRLLNTGHMPSHNDYDMYTIDVKSDMPPRSNRVPGIEVTTEMTQETATHRSSDEENLVHKAGMSPRE